MLPAVILLPLVLGFIQTYGQLHGLYDTAIWTGLLVIALILVFSILLWSATAHLSRSGEAEAKANESVRESEARLKHAQQIADVGSWEWDIITGALSWSDQTYRQMGEKPGQSTPSYEVFQQRVHPEDYAEYATAIERALGALNVTIWVPHHPFPASRFALSQSSLRFRRSTASMVGVSVDITSAKD
jgi:PAS domain-containing protein